MVSASFLKNVMLWEFPGGLVVKIPGFHCHSLGSVPGRGTEILQAARCGQKKKVMLCSVGVAARKGKYIIVHYAPRSEKGLESYIGLARKFIHVFP